MAMWNPWRGCKKCSEGCLRCYIHKGDAKRRVDTSIIEKTKDFLKPTERLKNGNYKMKSGIVYTCFSTDFLIEEADEWRKDCWQMIKERQDCTFLFLTKRIDRFMDCIPDDWATDMRMLSCVAQLKIKRMQTISLVYSQSFQSSINVSPPNRCLKEYTLNRILTVLSL